jgi:hypothetical protein
MANDPKPEEIIDITGPEGETLFWHALEHIIAKHGPKLQAELDWLWAHYKDISDERLLAVVAALCVENAIQELLEAFGPGFGKLRDNADFSFSLKISTSRALRIIPSRVLTACDLIRQIRNDFAHHLDRKALSQLDSDKYLRKLTTHVAAFNVKERDNTDYTALFKELVSFTLVALRTYIEHVQRLREYLQTEVFRQGFKQWTAAT